MSAATEFRTLVAKNTSHSSTINFGVIGYGYWGPNVVRNLDGLEGARVVSICDKSPAARAKAQRSNHGPRITSDASEVISRRTSTP